VDWERGIVLGGGGRGGVGGGGGEWELFQGVVSWVAWQKEVCMFFKVGRLGFFFFPRNSFFGDVGWLEKGGGYMYFSLFFS